MNIKINFFAIFFFTLLLSFCVTPEQVQKEEDKLLPKYNQMTDKVNALVEQQGGSILNETDQKKLSGKCQSSGKVKRRNENDFENFTKNRNYQVNPGLPESDDC